MLAIPDGKGGHRVIVRPDTYAEANLYPAFKGAAGSYNLIVSDVDGRLGVGASGRVVIDSGAPAVIVRTNPDAATGNPTFMILDSGDCTEPNFWFPTRDFRRYDIGKNLWILCSTS